MYNCQSLFFNNVASNLYLVIHKMSIWNLFSLLKYVTIMIYFRMLRLQVNVWETTLFGIAISATVACSVILRNIDFRKRHRRFELEHVLLLVTQCGVFLYFLFQILGGYYSLQNGTNGDPWRVLRLVTPIGALVIITV